MYLLKKIIIFILVILVIFPLGYGLYVLFGTDTRLVDVSMPITANVYQDLVDESDETQATHTVVKFFSNNKEISEYVAIPLNKIGTDSNGNHGVAIYDNKSDEPKYIAQIIEPLEATTWTEATEELVDEIAQGDVCFSDNSTVLNVQVETCDNQKFLIISWPISDDDTDGVDLLDDYVLPAQTDEEINKTDAWIVNNSAETKDFTPENAYTFVQHTPFNLSVNSSKDIQFGLKPCDFRSCFKDLYHNISTGIILQKSE